MSNFTELDKIFKGKVLTKIRWFGSEIKPNQLDFHFEDGSSFTITPAIKPGSEYFFIDGLYLSD